MRKCPNCKKAVPVGARRCVYCRMLITDSVNEAAPSANGQGQNSMTQMGFSNAQSDDYDSNNSTSLGLPGGNFASGLGSMDKRVGHHIDVNDAPHQTMIGLGPIASNPSRSNHAAPRDLNSGMHTIAGMPGVSFDPNEVAAFKARTTPMRNTPIRPSQAVLNSNDAAVNIPKGIRRSQVNMTPIVQPTSARPNQNSIMSAPQQSQQPIVRRQSQVNQPVIAKSSPQIAPAAPAPKPASNDNLLAGLPGVAPVPSSLVDEEFVDLTSKVFGSEFAGVNDTFDDEEDGLDFDFPAAPAKPQSAAKAPVSQASAAKAPAPQASASKAPASKASAPNVIPIPSIPQPKVNVQPASSAQPKAATPAQPAAEISKTAPESNAPKSATSDPVQKDIPLKKASGGAMDYITLILAIASAAACIAWLAFAALLLSALVFLASAAVLNIIIDGIYFPLRQKLPRIVMTLLFLVGVIALFVALFMQHSVIVSRQVYLLAMAGQFLTTICCFFRKS